MPFQRIENHGVIGNLCTAALVATDASIDFFCFPEFDSPTVFAALLDQKRGGSFRITPAMENMQSKQMYITETNILVTRFLSEKASAEVTDFMPVTAAMQKNEIVRIVKAIHGETHFEMNCQPAFDYARSSHTLERDGPAVVFRPGNADLCPMFLRATVPLEMNKEAAQRGIHSPPRGERGFYLRIARRQAARTRSRQSGCRFGQNARLLAGVAQQIHLQGALAGSSQPVSSRAETPYQSKTRISGGGRYFWFAGRYRWSAQLGLPIRLAARCLLHALRLHAAWLARRSRVVLAVVESHPSREALNGSGLFRLCTHSTVIEELAEIELDHLSGYKDSKPVRIGNGAWDQLQLDVYGEIMDAIYLYSKYGHSVPYDGWVELQKVLAWLGENWNQPDEGIWEVRGGHKHFLHSRLMCWVAFDRAIRLAHKRSLSAPLQEWYRQRDAIVEDIYRNFWNEKLQAFVQHKGSEALDAAVLLMPLVRFISPVDKRWVSTMKAIEGSLVEDAFVYRYRNFESHDGLDGEEGSFTCCSFWFVECLARGHQVEKARQLFDKLLVHSNHLGLFSEEICRDGHQLGNFPQALTHLALISAAFYLDRRLSGTAPDAWA